MTSSREKIIKVTEIINAYQDKSRAVRKAFLVQWIQNMEARLSLTTEGHIIKNIQAMLLIYCYSINSANSDFVKVLLKALGVLMRREIKIISVSGSIKDSLNDIVNQDEAMKQYLNEDEYLSYLDKLRLLNTREKYFIKMDEEKEADVAPDVYESLWELNDRIGFEDVYNVSGKGEFNLFFCGRKQESEGLEGDLSVRDCNRNASLHFIGDKSWTDLVGINPFHNPYLPYNAEKSIPVLSSFVKKHLFSAVEDEKMKDFLGKEYLQHLNQCGLIALHAFLVFFQDDRLFSHVSPNIYFKPIDNGVIAYIESKVESYHFYVPPDKLYPLNNPYYASIKTAVSMTAKKIEGSDQYQAIFEFVEPTRIHCFTKKYEALIEKFNEKHADSIFVKIDQAELVQSPARYRR